MRLFLVLSLLLLHGASRADDCLAIVDARLHLPAGLRFERGTVVVRGDRIVAVGQPPGFSAGTGAEATFEGKPCRVLARGGELTAGFIDSRSQIGLMEIGAENKTNDVDPARADPVHAAVRILDAWNPDASNVAVSRLEGVTTAVLSPAGGIVSGQMGAVSLGGDAAALKPYAAMAALGFSAGSRAEDLRFLRELFADARAFPAARAAWERGESREFAAASGDLLALQPVLSGEVPLVVSADRRSDVEAFVRFAEEQRIRIVIDGGAEAWLLRDELARRKIPVIVDPLLFGPSNFETLRARRDNAKLLAEAGVAVLFASHSAHFARKLRQLAGNAVREGMPHAHAMAAITEAPAAAFGLEGRGRIAPGAFADLVLWSGDPLEIGSEVRVLLIGGAELPLRSRQTELLARWRNLPGTPQPIPLPGTE